MHWLPYLSIVVVLVLAYFLLLKPQSAATPSPSTPAASGLSGEIQKIEAVWNHSGQTAKRWACFLAGAGVLAMCQALLGWFIP